MFAQKTDFSCQKLLLCTFYKDPMYIFEISLKIQIFDTPFSIFKEKNFLS